MVSVIIPTYNSRKYIEEALNSVFKQTYKDLEIIVVDDGSIDGTEELLKKYKDQIIYIKKTNGGEASARNKGLEVAKGDHICFLDADDLYVDDKIEKQIKTLNSFKDIDVVYNDVEVVDEELRYIKTLKSEGVYENQNDFLCMMIVRQMIPGTASMMFRRHCIETGIRYPTNYKNSVDYGFTIQLASKYKFKYIPETLYIYRRHEKNLTNNHENQKKCESDIVKKLGIDIIKKIVKETSFQENEKEVIFSQILMKIDNWNEAKTILEKLSLKYSNKYVCFYLGNCYLILGEYEKAESCYYSCIELDNNMAEAFNNLGCVYGILGLINRAEENFKFALALRSEYMDATTNMQLLKKIDCFAIQYKATLRQLRTILTNY